MGDEASGQVDAVLLFDECVPRMRECREGCQYETTILCQHRLNFKAYIFYASLMLVRRSDFRVVVRFFNLIRKNKFPVQISDKTKFVLVTIDKRFFKSSRKQAQAKRKINIRFDKEQRLITLGSHSISICVIKCRKRKRGDMEDLRCIIDTLNQQLS